MQFDATNKTNWGQNARTNDFGYLTHKMSGYKESFPDQKCSFDLSYNREINKGRSFNRGREIYRNFSSSGAKITSVPLNKFGPIVFDPQYRSANGDEINSAILSRIYELYGGEGRLFELSQKYNSVIQEDELILTELTTIEAKFGKKLFVDAYKLAQHTFDESDKEWEEYLMEERRRQAIFDER